MTTKRPHAAARGFSLMELMVVIAILGILTALVATNVMPLIFRGRAAAAQSDLNALKMAVQQYYFDYNKLPETLDVLTQPDPKYNDEPRIDQEPPVLDPWGNPYEYKMLGGSRFEITSFGADGMPGGEGEDADISSSKLKSQGQS